MRRVRSDRLSTSSMESPALGVPRGAAGAVVLCLVLLAGALAPAAEAGRLWEAPQWADVGRSAEARAVRGAWASGVVVVELASPPAALGGSEARMRLEREEFLSALERAGVQFQVRATYDAVLHGVALSLRDPGQAQLVASLAHVDTVYPSRLVPRPRDRDLRILDSNSLSLPAVVQESAEAAGAKEGQGTGTAGAVGGGTGAGSGGVQGTGGRIAPLDSFANAMTNVTEVHQQLGITGQGIRIGIVDTGVDYTHPAFGACKSIGGDCRVAYGYDFVGDEYAPEKPGAEHQVPKPDPDPMDCAGHGTHVAGIAAGNDTRFQGVAPDATLGAYRIFGCEGSTGDDVILSALEMAYKDGMDVINLSLGGGGWPQDSLSKAVDRLSRLGVVVCAAMGNQGGNGLWSGDSPGMARKALGVASFDNAFFVASTFTISPDNQEVVFTNGTALPFNFKDGEIAVSNNDTSVTDDGCAPYKGTPFKGKIALIKRGTCFFSQKALNAQAAGADAVIIYNRVPGLIGGFNADAKGLTIGIVGISMEDGMEMVNRSLTAPVEVTWGSKPVVLPNPTAGQVSSFSSWGPAPDLSFKPDVGAPGGAIFSSWPLKLGGYAVLSGTSMATPFLAGVSSLVLQSTKKAGRKARPGQVKRVLMNNAVPATLLGTGGPGVGVQTPVGLQGAGLVNALRALRSKTRARPASLALGYSKRSKTFRRVIMLTNVGKRFMRYSLSHVAAAAVNGTNGTVPELDTRPSKVKIMPKNLLLPPGLPVPVVVSITPDKSMPEDEFWLYSGYIKISPRDRKADPHYSSVFVPYIGFKGNYLAYQVLPKGDMGPFIASNATLSAANGTLDSSKIYSSPNETATFTFAKRDFPVFVTQLLHASPVITAKLYEAKSKKYVGYVGYYTYLPMTPPNPASLGDFLSAPWTSPEGLPAVMLHPRKNPDKWTPVPDGTYYVKVTAQKALAPRLKAKSYEHWRSPKIVIKTKET